ncbi:hypothetical protein J1G31_21365, partial [Pseudomonas tolaasii]|uniref:hypothetical protein n=1 Tax=Pseudomonas tolaasii TaxID=29442 RepID=UPI001CA74183
AERGNDQTSGIFKAGTRLIVPTLCVGIQPVTLRVAYTRLETCGAGGTRSVPGGVPTQSVGTINIFYKRDF